LRISEKGERIPLTMADTDTKKENNKDLFQEVRKTAKELGKLAIGNNVLDAIASYDKAMIDELTYGIKKCHI
jgi:hypothetical protein